MWCFESKAVCCHIDNKTPHSATTLIIPAHRDKGEGGGGRGEGGGVIIQKGFFMVVDRITVMGGCIP